MCLTLPLQQKHSVSSSQNKIIRAFTEIVDFVELTKDRDIEVRFIEYMPFDGNRWDNGKFFSFLQMQDRINEKYTLEKCEPASSNEVSKVYKVPGFKGRVGFITSMSQHFCGSCNRLRITADGNLKVCLFENREVSLRDAIREGCSDSELRGIVSMAVSSKKARHAGMTKISETKNRPMIKIGG